LRKIFILCLIAIIEIVAAPPASAASESSNGNSNCKIIFDATLYQEKPDLQKYGLHKVAVVDALRWWQTGESKFELTRGNGPEAWVSSNAPGDVLALDIEIWPVTGTPVSVAGTVSRLTLLANRLRKAGYSKPIGFYGLPPNRDYWRAIQGQQSLAYKKWQTENDALRTVANTSDVLFPSLYTFYNDADKWKEYAEANIREARRLASGKPVYAFLWPQFHESNQLLKGQYLPQSLWRLELQTALSLADGVVIWGGWQQKWRENAEWWNAVKELLNSETTSCSTALAPKPPEKLNAN